MRNYDPKDFAAHPAKYRLFSTATIARHVFTNNGEQDLAAGQVVGIKYHGTVRNQMFRRDEPVYQIRGTDRLLFGNVLADFVV